MKKINVLLSAIFIVALIALGAYATFNDHEYTITVTDKERQTSSGQDNKVESKYLVFGDSENEEGLVFQNTDNIFRRKWNSSNVQGKLKVGETYKITVVGFRLPLLSVYENIIKIEKVD